VLAGFREPGRLSSRNGVSLDPAAWGPQAYRFMSFLAMDPPKHTRMRALVSRAFTPRRVADLGPRILELTRRHLEPALEQGSFDFVGDFAGKLPMDVVSELLGVPEADRAELRRLADTVVHREDGVLDVPPAGMLAALQLGQYYAELIAERRRRRTDDLTSALLDATVDGELLADEEIIAFLFLMVVAGNETTTKLLANTLYWGWRNPDQLAKPLADPARVRDWVAETLRYDTSSQVIARTAAIDLVAHGQTVPSGDRVLLLVGSANRDPRAFPVPDRYDLDRDTSSSVSFGGGHHYCLGAPLAQLEAQIALGEFVRRVARYDVDEANAKRVHSVNVRGFATLPVATQVR
jgi:cytochrome P450